MSLKAKVKAVEAKLEEEVSSIHEGFGEIAHDFETRLQALEAKAKKVVTKVKAEI